MGKVQVVWLSREASVQHRRSANAATGAGNDQYFDHAFLCDADCAVTIGHLWFGAPKPNPSCGVNL